MADICLLICTFCRADFDSCKVWDQKTDSTVATAIRTIVVLLFSCMMVFVVGSQGTITAIEKKTLLFLVLSGYACVCQRL